MGPLTKEEIDSLLSQPMYTWDVSIMLGGVVDYLEFSENNLSLQRRKEIKAAKSEGDNAIFDSKNQHLLGIYQSQLIEAAEYRFDVTLSQSVRYGGLTAFITTIELCSASFEKSLTIKKPRTPDGENKYVNLLTKLNEVTDAGCEENIENIRKLVYVRNCLAHAAGLVDKYKHKVQLASAIESLNGFSIWDDNFLGASVHIQKGAIEKYAEEATFWVPKLHELCVTAGILKV